MLKNKKKITYILISVFLLSIIFIIGIYIKKNKKEVTINYVDQTPGFTNIGVKNKVLKTPALEKIEKEEYSNLYANPAKSSCGVKIESQRVVKEGSKYNWFIKAKRPDKDISFEISDAYKNKCLEDSECVCDKELLKNSGVCSFNPKGTNGRVYIQPYFVNLENQKNCSFDIDKIPTNIKNSNNEETYYLNIPKDSDESEEYKIEIPFNSSSINSGCLLASLDIVKVNNLNSGMCSVEGPSKDFILSSNNQTNKEEPITETNNNVFYSAEALKKTTKDYEINCYSEKDIEINKVGIQIYTQQSLTNTAFCSTKQCAKSNVLDSASSKEFVKYTIPYSFDKNGEYKVKCVKRN